MVSERIVGGPGRFRLWLNRLAGRPTAVTLEKFGPTSLLITAVQPLRGRRGMVSFVGGRLFATGQTMVAWGTYDTGRRTGQVWITGVPDCYTAYHGDPDVMREVQAQYAWRTRA